MERRRGQLSLGPIVGHTTHESFTLWIRVADELDRWQVRVGRRHFGFVPVDGPQWLGAGVAVISGLLPSTRYAYQVVRDGRTQVTASVGTFPAPGSNTPIRFVHASCSDRHRDGIWPRLATFVDEARPHFLLLYGDQVYLDDAPDVFRRGRSATADERRRMMAERYQSHWSVPAVRHVLERVPTYMMWDDHEIRDGWGCWAGDSLTLGEMFERGAPIVAEYSDYYADARAMFMAFQTSHNARVEPMGIAAPHLEVPVSSMARTAFPYWFDCGRMRIVMTDNRGPRDHWRPEAPALGAAQWSWLEAVEASLPDDIDAVGIVTGVPIVSMRPDHPVLRVLGGRTDDLRALEAGDEEELLRLQHLDDDSGGQIVLAIANAYLPSPPTRLKVGDIDDVRNQWSHPTNQPEQIELLRWAARASQRPGRPREVFFMGGDLHVGAMLDLQVDAPRWRGKCIIASSASRSLVPTALGWGGFFGRHEQRVAEGISASMEHFTLENNFGFSQVVFTGETPVVEHTLVTTGPSLYVELDVP